MRTSRVGQISPERVPCFVQAQTEYKKCDKNSIFSAQWQHGKSVGKSNKHDRQAI